MKLLLVLGSNDNYDIISKNLMSLGFELIRYRHVLKAMDNIDEICPSSIIISARDFPRHWKIFVQFVRNEYSKEVCPIIVLKGSNFSAEETSKAFFLGVSGIVDDSLSNPEEIDRLQNILSRYVPVTEKRNFHRYFVEPWHRVNFIITNIAGKSIITGEVKTISLGGLSFIPSVSVELGGSALFHEYDECSLRIGDAILSPVCRLVRIGDILSLEFIYFPKDERHLLDQFLENFSQMEPPSTNAS